ncbi:hypothetical protein FrEUN1fDRAFT_3376 [Parafrankia sp. EUN1f]|nr:hypothetical protein FrEUN1fDRAFT_3376 [Parafrankia sp. EUN1f]
MSPPEVRPSHKWATIRDEATAAALASAGARPAHVHLLPPGTIPKNRND